MLAELCSKVDCGHGQEVGDDGFELRWTGKFIAASGRVFISQILRRSPLSTAKTNVIALVLL